MPVHLMHPLSRRPILKLREPRVRSESSAFTDFAPVATRTTASEPDPVIEQAKQDLDAGMVDTDMHATPGLDAGLRSKMVPGPGGKPPTL